jgi:hypothetical protein
MNDGGATVAAGAAIAQAIKASGAIVRLEPQEFTRLAARQQDPLIVCAVGGLLSTSYQYLFSYKGLAFYTKSPDELPLPSGAEVVMARSIWIPG